MQLRWDGRTALIDPLAVDVAPLGEVLAGPGLGVLHAAQQDLEVLARACGAVPSRMFDTQLAAGFLGHSTPSLANLVAAELGVKLPKADRLSDWLRRPLTPDQLSYAAADVEHLLEVHDRQEAELVAAGRLEWALAECEELRTRQVGPGDPLDAWLRLKDLRTLRGRARNVARAVAASARAPRRPPGPATPVHPVGPRHPRRRPAPAPQPGGLAGHPGRRGTPPPLPSGR